MLKRTSPAKGHITLDTGEIEAAVVFYLKTIFDIDVKESGTPSIYIIQTAYGDRIEVDYVLPS